MPTENDIEIQNVSIPKYQQIKIEIIYSQDYVAYYPVKQSTDM
jgi:hypothetical protein